MYCVAQSVGSGASLTLGSVPQAVPPAGAVVAVLDQCLDGRFVSSGIHMICVF